jgi:hypothetical protein
MVGITRAKDIVMRSLADRERAASIGGNEMTDPAPSLPALPDSFDGFRLEIDPARERADVILDRAPPNVTTMAEREQLRAVFEALDAECAGPRHCIAGRGGTFLSGGEIRGFLDASPEHVMSSIIRRRNAVILSHHRISCLMIGSGQPQSSQTGAASRQARYPSASGFVQCACASCASVPALESRTARSFETPSASYKSRKVRIRLAAGGKWIRTVGPIPMRARNAELALMSTAVAIPRPLGRALQL